MSEATAKAFITDPEGSTSAEDVRDAIGTIYTDLSGGGDALGLDAPVTLAVFQRLAPHVTGTNQGRWFRVVGSGSINAIGIEIGTSSGNICVAVYRKTGTGRDARPGTRLATSGSVASPGTGYQEISLGATVAVEPGDFFYLGPDNSTVTFYANASVSADPKAIGLGFTMYANSAFPAPGDNPTVDNGLDGWMIAMVGILA